MDHNPVLEPAPDAISITVDGKPLACRPGISLAVALWDHGIRHLSHSHKYGRPRGVTCARGHCTNCLMRVDGIPNVRTCETTVRDGMTVMGQDTGAFYGAPMQKLLGLGSRWVPVGFYYKWFTRPATLSRFFLDRIRPMTGVGRLPDAAHGRRSLPTAAPEDPARAGTSLGRFAHVIVGGGPSGLQTAAACPGSTLLVDDFSEPGGQRLAALRKLATDGADTLARFPVLVSALSRLDGAIAALPTVEEFRFLGGAKVVAGYHPDGLLVRQGDELLTVHFDRLVWAAGALDTLGLFPGNDTPGVLGPRALYRLLARDGFSAAGQHALLIGGGMDLWLSAALLAAHGANVNLVVTDSGCQSEVAAAVDLKWPLNTGLRLEEIKSTGGRKVQASFVPRRSVPGPKGSHMYFEADLVVICNQGKPAYDVPYQLGADMELVPARGGFVPRGSNNVDSGLYAVSLPGGADLSFAGESLGLMPTDQVT